MEAIAEAIKLENYPAYKDSGVEWLGEIPGHWDCVKMKYLFRDISIKNKPDAELLSVTQNQGVVPRTWVENRMVMPSGNLWSFKFIQKGDFAISLRSFEGGLEYCHHDGIISPAYTVLKAQRDFESQYFKFLFKSSSFISELQTSVVGIREGKNISFQELSYSLLPIPPKEEQKAIAEFLDRKSARIDKAISIKEKQIELLKERRQILIHKAVTQGLNPDVTLKDSDVEWIEKIPEHWKTTRVKRIFRLIIDPAPVNNKCELLSIYTDIGVKPRKELKEKGNRASTTDGYWFVKKGDFIVNKLLAWMGAIGLSEYEGVTSPAYDILRPIVPIKGEYYHELFRTKLCSSELKKHSRGIMDVRLRLYFDKFGAIKVPFPPVEEQIQISEFIVKLSKKVFTAISCKEEEIEKLKEYKATLINSAVIGKIKVCSTN